MGTLERLSRALSPDGIDRLLKNYSVEENSSRMVESIYWTSSTSRDPSMASRVPANIGRTRNCSPLKTHPKAKSHVEFSILFRGKQGEKD